MLRDAWQSQNPHSRRRMHIPWCAVQPSLCSHTYLAHLSFLGMHVVQTVRTDHLIPSYALTPAQMTSLLSAAQLVHHITHHISKHGRALGACPANSRARNALPSLPSSQVEFCRRVPRSYKCWYSLSGLLQAQISNLS